MANISHSVILSSLLAGSCLAAENLGIIGIDSTTIDDRFHSSRTEASSTSTIDGQKVDDSHVENIQQVLNAIPGITTEVKTGDSLKIHIRGIENQVYMGEKPGVAVVIDGVPVFERTGAVNIDLDNIESIKVIKGGASYLFGDDALSGAVVITTKRGAKYNHNFAAVERGSFGYQKLVARTGYANDDLSFHIQASERKADGYHEDSDYIAQYVNGKFQYYLDDTSDVTFGLEASKRKKDSHGTVGGLSEALNNPESVYTGDMDSRDYTRKYDVDLLKLFLTYSKDFSENTNLLINGYVYTDDTYFWSSPQTKNALGASGTYTDDDYVYDNYYEQVQTGMKGEFRTATETFATLLGIDLRDNNYKNKVLYRVAQRVGYFPSYTYVSAGAENSNNETDENVYALYGEYKHGLTDRLSATFNVRYDAIKLDYTDSRNNQLDKSFDVYSYRIGSNYDLGDDNSLFANYSTGFRAPTISQLFAANVSTYGSTQNNPNLRPEHAKNYEAGVRGNYNGLQYEASLFRIDRKDFIMKTAGNYGSVDSTVTDMWDNIGGAKHQGFELSAVSKLGDKFSCNVAYTYLDAKYTDYDNFGIHFDADNDGRVDTGEVAYYNVTGNTIPRTSKHSLNVILDYQHNANFKLSAEYTKRSDYYADDLNRLRIDGQEALNLLAEYKAKAFNVEYSLFARIDNLMDNQYFNTARASSDRDENDVFDYEDLSLTVNPGRVYTAGLSIKF
ncbi:MAG: TonB-dependent receptor [Campylobacterota bacterium]